MYTRPLTFYELLMSNPSRLWPSVCSLGAAILLSISLLCAFLVFQDTVKRLMSPRGWTISAILFGPIALFFYYIFRREWQEVQQLERQYPTLRAQLLEQSKQQEKALLWPLAVIVVLLLAIGVSSGILYLWANSGAEVIEWDAENTKERTTIRSNQEEDNNPNLGEVVKPLIPTNSFPSDSLNVAKTRIKETFGPLYPQELPGKGPIVGRVPQKVDVHIIEEVNGFIYIKYGIITGWVRSGEL